MHIELDSFQASRGDQNSYAFVLACARIADAEKVRDWAINKHRPRHSVRQSDQCDQEAVAVSVTTIHSCPAKSSDRSRFASQGVFNVLHKMTFSN
jgi:hypothetical protein